MTANEYLLFLKNEIHSTVFATVDKNGLPKTCVIDIMLCDEDSLYFLTAKGKAFYDRLTAQSYVAISGMRGKDTMSTDSISLRGKVREVGRDLLPNVFAKNPYMAEIYPNEESRGVLTVFQLYEGEGECFSISKKDIFLECFSIGGKATQETGYFVGAEASAVSCVIASARKSVSTAILPQWSLVDTTVSTVASVLKFAPNRRLLADEVNDMTQIDKLNFTL